MCGDSDQRPLIAHVVYRFGTGGLENGVVNLINHLDPGRFRHAVIALTEVTAFAERIRRPDVEFISLNKPPGQAVVRFPKWLRILKALSPTVVHTRNLGAMEMQAPAAWAGVPVRIHGEHGRDMSDPHGRNRRYQWIRRAYRPLIHRHVALSAELVGYLAGPVGVSRDRISLIRNGVDSQRFVPTGSGAPQPISGCPFDPDRHIILGTVGRLQAEKDHATLITAFALLFHGEGPPRATSSDSAPSLRLVVAGDGPLRPQLESLARQLGIDAAIWWAGERQDVPDLMRGFHIFVLPSRAEGISNTLLEAMSSGLPAVATDVGGNPELVIEGQTGRLVQPADPRALAQAMGSLIDPAVRLPMGRAARSRIESEFSLDQMIRRYEALYCDALGLPSDAG